MNISILYGVASRHHLAVSKVDAHMTFPRRIIRSFKENKVAGLELPESGELDDRLKNYGNCGGGAEP